MNLIMKIVASFEKKRLRKLNTLDLHTEWKDNYKDRFYCFIEFIEYVKDTNYRHY